MAIPSEDKLKAALADRYVIQSELGEGGMATVYLADDLKHERKVALKVLKPELAAVVGAERFLAEIKTTANLQHPHILPLYDSGEADGFLFYVMPYVEGETLREKLDRDRQLEVDEAILMASDMAEALDYAHRNGVVHRDIKPANVLMSEGRPLIADFGIALAVGGAAGARLTETGLSVGTPFYMSPEQATGDVAVGHKTDIYALGCVLYEMLIGEPPYVGATAQAVLGKIIQGGSVSATDQRKTIPPHVDAVIRKSLEKLPADRFASAAGFAGALREPSFRYGVSSSVAAGSGWTRMTTVVAAVAAIALIAMGIFLRSGPEGEQLIERFGFTTIASEQIELLWLELGPEGTGMVFGGEAPESGGGYQLWYRRYDDLQPTPVPNSVAAQFPAISPDGSEVAFNAQGDLRVVPLAGGVTRTVADSLFCCPTWSADGQTLYFTRAGNQIMRVPATGGAPELILDAAGEGNAAYFRVTPSGESGIFTVYGDPTLVYGLDLATGERTVLTEGVGAELVGDNHIAFATFGGQLLVAPFEENPIRLTGAAVPLVEGMFITGNGIPRYSINASGTLAYWEGAGTAGTEMVWVDRTGRASVVDPEWTFGAGGGNRGWALSPDDSKIAVRAVTEDGLDIWIKELPDGPFTRLTFWDGDDWDPNWMPDSRTISFLSTRPLEGDSVPADFNLYMQVADGSRPAELAYDHPVSIVEANMSPDGTSAVMRSQGVSGVSGGRDVYYVDLAGDVEPIGILTTEFDESAPKISPDGRWLAYQSNESGRDQVYVRPYPDVSQARVQVSTNGGLAPRWARDGSELYYLSANREMMAAAIQIEGDELRVAERSMLFELAPGVLVGDRTTQYDVSNDGRFLMIRNATAGDEEVDPRMIMVRNFGEEVRTRVRPDG